MRFWEVIMAGGCGSGIGSIILDKVGIGQGSFNIVGAEVVITKDVPNKKNCNMYTIPTRVVKDALRNYCLIKQYIIKQYIKSKNHEMQGIPMVSGYGKNR